MSQPFRQSASTVSIAATTASANASIAGHQGAVVAHNKAAVWGYLVTGAGSTTTATAAGYWLAPGTSQSVGVPMAHDYAAVVLESGSGTVGVSPGIGE